MIDWIYNIYIKFNVIFKYFYEKWYGMKKFNNFIKIPYTIHGNTYFFLLNVKKNVIPVSTIIGIKNEINTTNIYDEIIPYLGINNDCHKTKLTPKDFGYDKIIITNVLDENFTFDKEDSIVLI